MLYPRCPTCKTYLSNKQLLFEEMMRKICNDKSLTEEEKDIEKMKVPSKLLLTRYCCRMRILTYIDEINTVK